MVDVGVLRCVFSRKRLCRIDFACGRQNEGTLVSFKGLEIILNRHSIVALSVLCVNRRIVV